MIFSNDRILPFGGDEWGVEWQKEFISPFPKRSPLLCNSSLEASRGQKTKHHLRELDSWSLTKLPSLLEPCESQTFKLPVWYSGSLLWTKSAKMEKFPLFKFGEHLTSTCLHLKQGVSQGWFMRIRTASFDLLQGEKGLIRFFLFNLRSMVQNIITGSCVSHLPKP